VLGALLGVLLVAGAAGALAGAGVLLVVVVDELLLEPPLEEPLSLFTFDFGVEL